MIQGLYPLFDHWHQTGTVYLYSDPHFNDPEQRLMCPYWPDDDEQVKKINAKVGRADTLIILGDIGDVEYVKKLRAARKILVMGNHDAGASNYQRKVCTEKFDIDHFTRAEVLEKMKELYPNCAYQIDEEYDVSHAPFHFWKATADNKLFDEVYSGALIIGEKLILSHEPVPQINWALSIHGHDHSSWTKDQYHYNVCSNVIGFEPINFNQFMKAGHFAHIDTIHRICIDNATKRSKKRKGK